MTVKVKGINLMLYDDIKLIGICYLPHIKKMKPLTDSRIRRHLKQGYLTRREQDCIISYIHTL